MSIQFNHLAYLNGSFTLSHSFQDQNAVIVSPAELVLQWLESTSTNIFKVNLKFEHWDQALPIFYPVWGEEDKKAYGGIRTLNFKYYWLMLYH